MFKNSIDKKSIITDPDGNQIVDLAEGTFKSAEKIVSYTVKKVPNEYIMRPDLISLVEYGTTDKTEYIMMFNQIGNPFSINKDDELMIPDIFEVDTMMYNQTDEYGNNKSTDASVRDLLVKNYYKHSARHNTVDMDSYDTFENTPIPSGNVDTAPTETQARQQLPYMLNDDEGTMTIKNGKIYFNDPNDVGLQNEEITSNNVDAKIQSVLNGVSTKLSDSNCTYNGTNLGDFIKALNKENSNSNSNNSNLTNS